MSLTIDRSALLSMLDRVMPAVPSKTPQAVLLNVLLRAEGGTLTMSATNAVLSAVASAPAEGDLDTLADARTFYDCVKASDAGPMTLAHDGDKLSVRAGKRRFSLPVWGKPSDFPPLAMTHAHDVKPVELPGAALATALGRVLPTAGTDESRAYLNSVLLETTATGYRLVTTDGHRLTLVDVPAEGLQPGDTVLLPLQAATALARLASGATSVTLAWTPSRVVCGVPGHTLAVPAVDATFPPYAQVVPSYSEVAAVVDRAVVGSSLRALRAVSAALGARIELAPGVLRVSAAEAKGEAQDEVEVKCSRSVLLGLKPSYVLDALESSSTDSVELLCGSELDPVLLRSPGVQAIVMPMRV